MGTYFRGGCVIAGRPSSLGPVNLRIIELKIDKGVAPMNNLISNFSIKVETTDRHCPIGETTGKKMMNLGQIPVISCEGSCIRGEIARLAANMMAKEDGYGRGCHGEIISVPQSAMAKWATQADKIVVIDGCFLHCHGRILKGLFKESKLAIFDALSFYGKYTDIMDIDDVPENERKETANMVMNNVIGSMKNGGPKACAGKAETVSCGSDTAGDSAGCQDSVPDKTASCCGG